MSADVHLARESTAALDEPALAAERRTTKANTSDYLKMVLKEAGRRQRGLVEWAAANRRE